MECLKPFAVAAILAIGTSMALAQTITPETTEKAKSPAVFDPAPAAAPLESATKTEPGLAQTPSDLATSALVGAAVYNTANDHVGEVEDVIISSNGSVSAVVIGVGGFLGLGEKKVAMPFAALKMDKGDNKAMKVVIEGTKESLKAMPIYKYVSS